MTSRQDIENKLQNSIIYNEVYSLLSPKVKQHLTDYILLKELSKQGAFDHGNPKQYSDYSFLITPVFKALEGVLLHIANGLGMEPKKYNFKTGQIFDEKKLEKLYLDVLEKIEGLDEIDKDDVRQWLNSARRILKHFRHNPAHFLGDVQITVDRAIMTGDTCLETINQLYKSLINAGLTKDRQKFIDALA